MLGAKLKAVAELDEFLRGGYLGEDIGDEQGAVDGDAVDGYVDSLLRKNSVGAELVGWFHDVFSSSKVS